jgi:hypothetical protein
MMIDINKPLVFKYIKLFYLNIVGHNNNRYTNRLLYINNTGAFVLTGDKLVIRFAHDQFLSGTFITAIIRGDKGKWLQDCDSITSFYIRR